MYKLHHPVKTEVIKIWQLHLTRIYRQLLKSEHKRLLKKLQTKSILIELRIKINITVGSALINQPIFRYLSSTILLATLRGSRVWRMNSVCNEGVSIQCLLSIELTIFKILLHFSCSSNYFEQGVITTTELQWRMYVYRRGCPRFLDHRRERKVVVLLRETWDCLQNCRPVFLYQQNWTLAWITPDIVLYDFRDRDARWTPCRWNAHFLDLFRSTPLWNLICVSFTKAFASF